MIVATIEHSGTFQLLEMLDYERRNMRPIRERKDGLRFCHLYNSEMPLLLECAKLEPVVTTYRPEADIRASWIRRGKDLSELDQQLSNYARLLETAPYVMHLGRIR